MGRLPHSVQSTHGFQQSQHRRGCVHSSHHGPGRCCPQSFSPSLIWWAQLLPPDHYFPFSQKPSMFDVSRELGSSVALYSRKVLIQTKATDILPKWLRFVRGAVPDTQALCCGRRPSVLSVTVMCPCAAHCICLCCVPDHAHPAELSMRQAGESSASLGNSTAVFLAEQGSWREGILSCLEIWPEYQIYA